MCSTGIHRINNTPRATFLPVIVGIVFIINITILTVISRFG